MSADRAVPRGDRLACGRLTGRRAQHGIVQEPDQLDAELAASCTTTPAPAVQQQGRGVAEVRRVGPEQHRLAAQRRARACCGRRTAPGCRPRTPRRRSSRAGPARRPCRARSRASPRSGTRARQLAAPHRGEAARRHQADHLADALGMARRDDQRQVGPRRAARPRARRAPPPPRRGACCRRSTPAARAPDRAAGARDRRRRPGSGSASCLTLPVTTTRSGVAPSAITRRASSSDCMPKTRHVGQHPSHGAAHEPVAAERAVGQPAVGDHRRHAAGGQRAQQIRPQLRLHAHEEGRADRGDDPARRRREDRAGR